MMMLNDDNDFDDADDPDGAFDLHFCPPVTMTTITRRPLDDPDDVYHHLGALMPCMFGTRMDLTPTPL
jgi:hypothetical protein